MAIAKRRRRNPVWVWLAAAMAVVLVFYAARLATRTRIPVRTAIAQRGELRSTSATNGKVEPQLNFEAHAPFPGLIKTRYVHEGQRVTQGTLLLSMDDTDARTRLAGALAALRNSQATYSATLKGGTQ